MNNVKNNIDLKKVGIVVIGRNEGERLKRCLSSLDKFLGQVVYVDSGSTDGSASYALSLGCSVVELDMSIPFTAARARNAGVEKLEELYPHLKYVQFVDGDCEVNSHWITKGTHYLAENENVGCVFGNLDEVNRDYSVYNMLCDMEWKLPTGEIHTTLGIFMVKIGVFRKVQGFDSSLICGEEPELCKRIRELGYKIFKIDEPMAKHDANILKFSQWWNRTKRSGYAYAKSPGTLSTGKAKLKSIAFWGALLPLAILFLSTFNVNFSYCFIAYVLQWAKITKSLSSYRTEKLSDLMWYSFYLVIGKIPQAIGVFSYIVQSYLNKPEKLIEYK